MTQQPRTQKLAQWLFEHQENGPVSHSSPEDFASFIVRVSYRTAVKQRYEVLDRLSTGSSLEALAGTYKP